LIENGIQEAGLPDLCDGTRRAFLTRHGRQHGMEFWLDVQSHVSSLLQVRYGFGPPFIGTIILYTISVVMYWAFFWRRGKNVVPASITAD
jgi:hypothetical protein